MKFRNFFSALLLIVLSSAIFSCTKTELSEPSDEPVVKYTPQIPSGNLIYIHFGTATQRGCMYSFSNCIWIGWGTEALNYQDRMALQFGEGDAAGEYFGQYFPLTGDFVVDAATAAELGIPEQVIPAGFYALRDVASGQATGKRVAQFGPEFSYPVASPINANNPQDNLGQLHNLAVQVVLHENRDALKALKGDREGTRKLLTEKLIAFFEQAELPIPAADRQFAQSVDLYRDYHNYAARIEETRLSDNDKKALLAVFDEAAGIPVNSPESLSKHTRHPLLCTASRGHQRFRPLGGLVDDERVIEHGERLRWHVGNIPLTPSAHRFWGIERF